ncbi:hypothetical protein FGIG_03613 [Fasciola gigantica]|uniref:Uncharacterized protein n=1 Tax=Fasciola gigantica TaxID=46835 RepID=A0A504YJY9_FASGI|nr:hypothetical protein FGIG_03613 [Fasciola gigantica]
MLISSANVDDRLYRELVLVSIIGVHILCKPDLIVSNGDIVYVLDVCVVSGQSAENAWEMKVEKYSATLKTPSSERWKSLRLSSNTIRSSSPTVVPSSDAVPLICVTWAFVLSNWHVHVNLCSRARSIPTTSI